jgi:hypothetical protein
VPHFHLGKSPCLAAIQNRQSKIQNPLSYFTELRSASNALQGALAEAQGATPGEPNLTGPDGHRYTGVWRAPNAFEEAGDDSSMSEHGFQDRETLILTITKSQFSTVPLGWRRGHLTLDDPQGPISATVATLTTTDPHLYTLILRTRQ